MGYKNKKYSKSLHQQMMDVLTGMQAFGESKKEDKHKGLDTSKRIYSHKSFQVNKEQCSYFIKYIKIRHPECRSLKQCRRYVPEYLKYRESLGLSAWTLSTQNASLCKLFSIKPGDPDWYTPPKRRRVDLKRSRGERVRDKHFSLHNNEFLVKFASAIGARRRELSMIKGQDLLTRQQIQAEVDRLLTKAKPRSLTKEEQKLLRVYKDALLFKKHDYFIYIKYAKGGRDRISPLVSSNEDIEEIVARFRQTDPNDKIFANGVNTNLDVHNLRAVYANRVMTAYQISIDSIPYDRVDRLGRRYQSGVYVMRGDMKGLKLDKNAMRLVSKALGHNRLDVFASSYLR